MILRAIVINSAICLSRLPAASATASVSSATARNATDLIDIDLNILIVRMFIRIWTPVIKDLQRRHAVNVTGARDPMFTHFDTIPACDGRTDRRIN